MSALSNYAENATFNLWLRNTAVTPPTTIYVGLFTADPGESGNTGEIAIAGYSRLAVTFGAPTDGSGSNTVELVWDPATANWGSVTHLAIYDDPTAGNMILHGALSAPQTVNLGDSFRISIGNLIATFS